MLFILSMMLFFIVASLAAERILPIGLKNRLGTVICWSMMFVTMSVLTLATLGLGALVIQRLFFI